MINKITFALALICGIFSSYSLKIENNSLSSITIEERYESYTKTMQGEPAQYQSDAIAYALNNPDKTRSDEVQAVLNQMEIMNNNYKKIASMTNGLLMPGLSLSNDYDCPVEFIYQILQLRHVYDNTIQDIMVSYTNHTSYMMSEELQALPTEQRFSIYFFCYFQLQTVLMEYNEFIIEDHFCTILGEDKVAMQALLHNPSLGRGLRYANQPDSINFLIG